MTKEYTSEPSPEQSGVQGIKPGHHYHGFSWRGIPFRKVDIDYVIDQMRDIELKYDQSPENAFQAAQLRNESVANRSNLLISFSAILITVSLFIVGKLPVWQRLGFYIDISIWTASTIWLLWSRMGRYNIGTLVAIVCFVVAVLLLMSYPSEIRNL